MKAVLPCLFVVLLVSSCILDPNPPPPKPPSDPLPPNTLEHRDDALRLLNDSYNTRNSQDYERLLDEAFLFFFSPADISEGNVEFSQWGRVEEVGATKNLFNPGYTPPSGAPVSSITLTMTYAQGEDSWIVIPGSADNGHPGEDWYEKTIQYLLTVKAGETTFTSGTPINASLVVRQTLVADSPVYRVVQWRDDI